MARNKAFSRLARRVAAEYRRKGVSARRARYIGDATAGEVARRKRRRAT